MSEQQKKEIWDLIEDICDNRCKYTPDENGECQYMKENGGRCFLDTLTNILEAQ